MSTLGVTPKACSAKPKTGEFVVADCKIKKCANAINDKETYSGPAPYGSPLCPVKCKEVELLLGEFMNQTDCAIKTCTNRKDGEMYTGPAPSGSQLCPVAKSTLASCDEKDGPDLGPAWQERHGQMCKRARYGDTQTITWMCRLPSWKGCPSTRTGPWNDCLDADEGCKPVTRFYASGKLCCPRKCAYEKDGKQCKIRTCG